MATRLKISDKLIPSRVPPHNLEAEESVLGACLISREAIANVLEVITADDFYKPAHSEIFSAILALYGAGEPVDAVTLAEELRRRGTLETFGGKPYLHTLVAAVPTPGSATHYARIVGENALLRRLIDASQEISDIAFSIPEDVEEAVDHAENLVYQVSQRRVSEDFQPLRDLLTENMELVEKLYERGSTITGLPTGFTELDNITAGFQPANLIIIAARPSQGKSSLSLSIAQHVAVTEQAPVVIFSLEMSKMELVQRLICAEARVDSNRLRRGALQDSDWPKLSHALGRLAEAPLFIDDTASVTIMEIRAKCRRLASKYGLGLVIVDYLQLMTALRRTENRVQEVSEISRSLKILARELNVPVIAVSQLSRNVEYRADKRPMLADLRESGCLTKDTRVLRADTGQPVTMGDLLSRGERNIPVWTVNDDLKIVKGIMTHVFSSGVKSVFRLQLKSGREIKASGNHPFLTFDGWKRLDELAAGERVAIARVLPEPEGATDWPESEVILLAHLIGDGSCLKDLPLRYASTSLENLQAVTTAAKSFGVTARQKYETAARSFQLFLPSPHQCARGRRNPINEWMDELGLFGKRAHEKFVPSPIFSLRKNQVALFLKHLWATDGHVGLRQTSSGLAPNVFYSTSSRRLANDVSQLLLRLGIVARIGRGKKPGYRDVFAVHVGSGEQVQRFVEDVGAFGPKRSGLERVINYLASHRAKAHHDTIPPQIWERVRELTGASGLSLREVKLRVKTDFRSSLYQMASPSRDVVGRLGAVFEDNELTKLASSDLFWDGIDSIDLLGEEEVVDATVIGTHNFLAEGIVVENSLEQDSDLVLFIYRDEVYNSDSPQRGIAEIHVAKHRNGPIGKVDLAFLEHYTKFANLAKGV